MPTVIREHTLTRQPWKNGGGTTAEVAAAPPGAGFQDFAWRISMADVASDGPFSRFPGIDRTLVLVRGAALELLVDGVAYRLSRAAPILRFAGDDATEGRLPAGPIRDLNVMTRRGRASHHVSIVPAGPLPIAGLTFVVAHDAALSVAIDGDTHALGPLDCLRVDSAAAATLDAPALVIGLSVRPGPRPA